jgi:hypothetical protein
MQTGQPHRLRFQGVFILLSNMLGELKLSFWLCFCVFCVRAQVKFSVCRQGEEFQMDQSGFSRQFSSYVGYDMKMLCMSAF